MVEPANQQSRVSQDPDDVEYPVGQDLVDWINSSEDVPLDRAHAVNSARWSKDHNRKFRKFSESTLRSIEFFFDNPWQKPQGPLLDMGCAGGHHLKYCADRGIQPLYGIDIAEPFVKIAQERVPQAVIQRGDLLNLPYESNSFNAVVARGVLHITTTKGLLLALKEAQRVLKEGGLLYIHTRYKPALLEQNKVKRVRLFTYVIYKEARDRGEGSPRKKIGMIRNFVPVPQLTSIIESVGFALLGDPPATISELTDERGDVRYNVAYICRKHGSGAPAGA